MTKRTKPSDPPQAPKPRRKGPKRRLRGALVRRAERRVEAQPPRAEVAPAPSRVRRAAGPIALAVAALLAGGGIYLATRPPPVEPPAHVVPQRGLLDAIPAGALAVVTADVRALRASPLAAPYLGGTKSVPGFDDVRQACGFDLIATVDELAIAVPDGTDADFGIVAKGGFSDAAILACAAKVVESRGGSPVTTQVGSFKSVRDAGAQASAGETAARPGGLLLWGGGPYLKRMIQAADGAAPTLGSGSLHERLRADLAGYETVQASYVFSDEQRQIVRDEIEKAQGRAPDVLAHIVAAGIGVRLVGAKTNVLLVLLADDPARAPELSAWLEETRAGAASGLATQLLGAGPLLQRISIRTEGAFVRADVEATVTEIESIVDRALKVRALLREGARPREQPAPPPAPSGSGIAAPSPSASAAP